MTRKAARDLIVVVSSSRGWKYPLARMVTDTEGNAAVFAIPRGRPPVQQFTFVDRPKQGPGMINAIRGELRTAEGETITYRRRGASCGYALAKCNVKTPALMRLWPDPPVEPMRAEVASPEPDPAPADDTATAASSVATDGEAVEPGPAPEPASEPVDMSLAAMREWAKQNGYEVKDRGRLPVKVVEAYKVAHGL